jgi:nitrile hydratase
MNGIHDLGGMHGLGRIDPETDEPVFHAEWETRAFAMFAATYVFAGYTVDELRHDIEQMGPAEYLESSYYEHWVHAFERVLARRGIVTREEIDARVAQLAQGAH